MISAVNKLMKALYDADPRCTASDTDYYAYGLPVVTGRKACPVCSRPITLRKVNGQYTHINPHNTHDK